MIAKSKVKKPKADKVENISLPDFLDMVKVPKKVKDEMVKKRFVTTSKKPRVKKDESAKRTTKSEPKKITQTKKAKGVGDRQKRTLAKEDKKKKGKPKKVRGSGRPKLLVDYFFEKYHDILAIHNGKLPLLFMEQSVDYLPSKYPYFVTVIRPCKLTVRKVINENGFNPYDDTKERELCIFEVLTFSDELSGAEIDFMMHLRYFTECKAQLIVFHSKEQIDQYLAKVANKEE